MRIWLLLAVVFIAQEPITSSAVMLSAYKLGYSVWGMHALFLAATIFDAIVGYEFGRLLERRVGHTRIAQWVQRRLAPFRAFAGRHSKRAALLLWGPFFFPYTAVAAPWLGYSFGENLVLGVIGNTVVWYASEWLVILGVNTFIPDPILALVAVAGISLVLIVIGRLILTRSER